MITAEQILESLADPTDKEVVVTLMNTLSDWLAGGHYRVPNQSIFSFYKRNVPGCIYTGKAYRVIWIELQEAVDKGLIQDYKHLDDLLKLTTPQVRELLQKDKKFLSRVTSWAKTQKGIKGAIRAMEYKNFNSVQVLITDQITGIDVMKVLTFLKTKIMAKKNKYPKTLIKQYNSKLGVGTQERKWATSQEEIIAPFNPGTFQVVSIKRS